MIRVNQDKCIGCGLCISDCSGKNIVLENGKAKVKNECFECGHCIAICPQNAFEADEYDFSEVKEYDAETFSLDTEVLLNVIQFRRSIRNYQDKKVEREKLAKIVEAGRYTATAKNNQETFIVMVQEEKKELQKRVWEHIDNIIPEDRKEIPRDLLPYVNFNRRRKANPADDYLFKNAPVVALITSEWVLDPGMAAQNMELVAVSEGLGALYNGFLARAVDSSEEIKGWLGIAGKQVKGCMLFGYPAVSYKRTAPRKPANVIWR